MTDYAFAAVQAAANRRAPHMHQSTRLPQIAREMWLMAGDCPHRMNTLYAALGQCIAAQAPEGKP